MFGSLSAFVQMTMPATLADLPNEVIFQILLHVPPSSTPNLQRISRRFNEIAQPLLWKHHCRTHFRYWSEEHGIKDKLSDNMVKVDWKNVFVRRHSIDRETSNALDSIIDSQLGRIEQSERIVRLGYDTKDTLLRNINVGDDTEDVLARRYYSSAVLGHLHRTMAIMEWAKFQDGGPVSLERALAAFDMFVLRASDGDFDDVTTLLDRLAESILAEIPELANRRPRQKALAVLVYLRANNWTGIASDEKYHDLQNNFIGIALRDKNHPSLPLISVAIYCCVATRLGLDAQPCGFPFHVIAIIKAPENIDLDGRAIDHSTEAKPMFLDPFKSDDEVQVEDLQTQLSAMAVAPADYATLLGPASIEEIVRRTARNIITSVQHGARGRQSIDMFAPEMESAFYAALWALVMLPDSDVVVANLQPSRCLTPLVEYLEKEFFMDIGMIETTILPRLPIQGHHEQLLSTLRVIRASNSIARGRRTRETAKRVKYRVGQVFKHKRYAYVAIITGWDMEGGEGWRPRMGAVNDARGRHQIFYRVLVQDSSVRYVAEDNIEIAQLDLSGHSLMDIAGRYFKRWDKSSGTFVSNIRDEYPDD